MKKVISYFILMFICIFSFNFSAKGYVMYESNIEHGDSCINDRTCHLMCSYHVERPQVSADGHPYSLWYGIDILYDYQNSIKIVIDNDKLNKYQTFVLSDSAVKFNAMITENGECPKYAYIDVSAFNEVCFDSDGEFCKSKNNMGTSFSESSNSKKVSDVMDQFETYFTNNAPRFNCDDIYNGKTKDEILSQITNGLNIDIKTNYFNGNDIPTFISSSERYKTLLSDYQTKTNNAINNCKDRINNDEDLTEEQRQNHNQNLDGVAEEITDAIDTGTSSKPSFDDYEGNDVEDCDILGVEFKEFLEDMFRLIQIVGPILALILGMLDLLKAVASGEDDAKKKAFKNLGYRMIAALLLFLIPAIMTFMLSLIPGLGGTCGIG